MDKPKSKNLFAVESRVALSDRWDAQGHRGGILWFTGLSGSGKTTLALELERQLTKHRYQAFVLDGDNIRHGLNKNLGFSPEDRAENIRRIGEVANLFVEGGSIVMTAFISPYREDRDMARALVPEGRFFEIHVDCALDICEERDPKGLYKKARAGEIKEFTGIDAPYEAPEKPEIVIDTGALSLEESVQRVIDTLKESGILS